MSFSGTSIKCGFLPAILLLLGAASLSAQEAWVSIGPDGADVRDLAQDPDNPARVYAATASGGVYFSADAGQTWIPRRTGLPTEPTTGAFHTIYGITVDPVDGRVYASASSGIYYSDNARVSWDVLPRPAGAIGFFGSLLIDPADNQVLVVQNKDGVFASNDRGLTWTEPAGITETFVQDLERASTDPNVVYAVAGYDPNLTLYRSDDRVASWTTVGLLPGAKFRDLAVDPTDASRLYLSLESGCFVSTNFGVTWVRMDDPQDAAQIFHFVDVGGSVLGIGRGGLFSNGQNSDRLDAVGNFYHTRATGSVMTDANTILLSTRMGVFEGPATLVNGFGSFTLRVKGMSNADITVVAPAPGSSVVYAASGQAYDAGVFRSDNGGETWELRSLGISNPDVRSIAVFPGDPDIVYVGTTNAVDDTGENGGVFKTTDGGLTWTDVTAGIFHSGPRIIIAILVHPTNPDIVYASVQASMGGIYRTLDGGTTWTRLANGLESMPITPGHEEFHNYFAMLSMTFDPVDPSIMYLGAGGCWGGTYRSNNGGNTWTRYGACCMEFDSEAVNFGTAMGDTAFWFAIHLELFDFDVDPGNRNHLFATGARGEYMGAGQFGIIYESYDSGQSWSILRRGTRTDYFPSPTTGLVINQFRPGELYVSTRSGVEKSADGGATWNSINEGLVGTATFARSLAMNPGQPNRLYLSTALDGVWVRDLSPVSVRLTHIDARQNDRGEVEITWGVADAVDHLGFAVDREVNGERTRLTSSLLRGNQDYLFVDAAPVTGITNRYWVVEIDRSGRETEYGPLETNPGRIFPRFLNLAAPYPNPFQDETVLHLSIPAGVPVVSVQVFDTQGRMIRNLEPKGSGGSQVIRWDGTDQAGRRTTSGVYFIRAATPGGQAVRRVLLLP